jgi:ABC-type phosphate transport system substrate-binding protein
MHRMSRTGHLRLAFAAGLFLAAARARAEDFKVIVHPSNPAASVSRRQLAGIFLRKSAQWPNGTPAQPVDRTEDTQVREGFSKEVLGRSASAVKSYWVQRVFSGRGLPPPEKPSEAEILDYVRKHRGAVGYAKSPTDDVKVLTVEP